MAKHKGKEEAEDTDASYIQPSIVVRFPGVFERERQWHIDPEAREEQPGRPADNGGMNIWRSTGGYLWS